MKKKITIISMFCFLWIGSGLLWSQTKNYGSITYGKAINISGKQRMLSQKMSKAYVLLARGINDAEIKKELNASKFIFEKQLQILTENATSSAVKLSFKNVSKLWEDFKELISIAPNLTTAAQIMETNTPLLKACNEAVMSIENNFNYNNQFFQNKNKDLVNTINVSGKQRMLSQRLCLYYAAATIFPNENKAYKNVLTNIFNEFDSVIGNLLISSYNTTEIEEELGSVMAIWEKFQTNQKALYNGGFELREVFQTTNQLTKMFNKITGLYEALSSE